MKAIFAAVVAATAMTMPATAASPPTKTAGVLTVGLAMPSAGFQVGSVQGRTVVLAKGMEIDLARALAKQLKIPHVRFLNETFHSALLRGGRKDWDIALAEISITAPRASRVDFSTPYLRGRSGCARAPGSPGLPRSLSDLRKLKLCAERATTGALLVLNRIKPTRKPLIVPNPSQLSMTCS